jgi:hypothetical protein
VNGSNGAPPGRCHFSGAELANCGNWAVGNTLDVSTYALVWSWLFAESPPLSVPANPLKAPAVPLIGNGAPLASLPLLSTWEYAPSQYCSKSFSNGRHGYACGVVHSPCCSSNGL